MGLTFYSASRVSILLLLSVLFINNAEAVQEKRYSDAGFIAMISVYFIVNFILVGAYYTFKHFHIKRKQPSITHAYQPRPNVNYSVPISLNNIYLSTNQSPVTYNNIPNAAQRNQPITDVIARNNIIPPTVRPDSIIPDFGPPSNWNKYEDGRLVVVGEECLAIKRLVYQLWESNRTDVHPHYTSNSYIHILNITKNENHLLFDQYDQHRNRMNVKKIQLDNFRYPRQFSGPIKTTYCIDKLAAVLLKRDVKHKLNEHYLFHGTTKENVSSICEEGFKVEYAHDGWFGKGTYFAEDPKKSDGYTGPINENKTTILARVCLGELFVTNKRLYNCTSPPCRNCLAMNCNKSTHEGTFDSAVADRPNKFREFIVYDDARAYPEYVIQYKHVADDSFMRDILVHSDA